MFSFQISFSLLYPDPQEETDKYYQSLFSSRYVKSLCDKYLTVIFSIIVLFCFRRQHYDVYHDCNPKEISRALPVLSCCLSRLQEILQEWPEHPTLVQVNLFHVDHLIWGKHQKRTIPIKYIFKSMLFKHMKKRLVTQVEHDFEAKRISNVLISFIPYILRSI